MKLAVTIPTYWSRPDGWQEGDASPRYSWYEPLRDREALRRAVHFVLGRPGLFLNSSSDATLLREILEAASETAALPSDATLEADVAHHAMRPLFEPGVAETI